MQQSPPRLWPSFSLPSRSMTVLALAGFSLGFSSAVAHAGSGAYRGPGLGGEITRAPAKAKTAPSPVSVVPTPEVVRTQTLGGPAVAGPPRSSRVETPDRSEALNRPETQTRTNAQARPPAGGRASDGIPVAADPNSTQPPTAFGPTPFDLGRIRAVQIGSRRVVGAPQRVGNVDLLSPLADDVAALGISVSSADSRNIPTLFGVPSGDFFQINLPKGTPIVLAVNRATAWGRDENGQPYETPLRSAPLVIGGKLYLPVFSLAPLVGAAPRLAPDGTLVLSPTVESVQMFPVRNTVAITIKTSAPVPEGAFRVHNLAADARNPARFYVDFSGFSMGFDAGYSTAVRLVANGTGDVIGARAGQVSTLPNEEITRVTFDLRRPLAANFTRIPSDPTLFTLVMGPIQENAPVLVTPNDVGDIIGNLENDIPLPPRGNLTSRQGGYALTTSSQILKGISVVVDAGHGGRDPGARGARSHEKQHTLALALKLQRELQARGATVHMTRVGDTYPSLSDRVNFANSRRADLFISIHMNASVNKGANGTETFYYTGQSRNFAAAVHREFAKATGRKDRGIAQARFYVIRNTSMPAVLLECAFISNAADEAASMSDDWRKRVARGVAQGVVNYVVRFRRPGISR